MLIQLHRAKSYHRMIMIRYGYRHCIKMFTLFIIHFAPIIVILCFWKFFSAICGFPVIHITQKCNLCILVGRSSKMSNIVHSLTTATDRSDVQFITGCYKSFSAQNKSGQDKKSSGCQCSIFNEITATSCIFFGNDFAFFHVFIFYFFS